MSQQQPWPKIAVVGAGAVGGYFGGLLARAGAPVVMIGRPAFVEAVKKKGLFLETLQFQESVKVEASTELSAAGAALPAVVYVAASVPEAGRVKHVGRGDLVIGPQNEKTERVAALFARANVPCRISQNIEGELWTKLVWNCALNAVSALGHAKYGPIATSADAWKVVETAVYEVLAVARAAGIHPPGLEDPKAALAGALKIATQMAEALSSTGQDLNRGKRTEIDSLNGYIARRGAALGVPTPVNHTLYALVKLAEGRS